MKGWGEGKLEIIYIQPVKMSCQCFSCIWKVQKNSEKEEQSRSEGSLSILTSMMLCGHQSVSVARWCEGGCFRELFTRHSDGGDLSSLTVVTVPRWWTRAALTVCVFLFLHLRLWRDARTQRREIFLSLANINQRKSNAESKIFISITTTW